MIITTGMYVPKEGEIVRNTGRHEWEGTALHLFLCELFPAHRTKNYLFDVNTLSKQVGVSYEAVYQWLRKGCVPAEKAMVLSQLAGEIGSRTPELSEWNQFVYVKKG